MLTIDNVYRASHALKGVARKTDVLYAPKLCAGAELYLKTENLQITGSFKVRGQCPQVVQLCLGLHIGKHASARPMSPSSSTLPGTTHRQARKCAANVPK